MYEDIYELPQLKPDITLGKIIVTALTIAIFLVLPVWYIDSNLMVHDEPQPVDTSSSGSVAGAFIQPGQNESVLTLPFTQTKIDLSSESGLYILVGTSLIALSGMLSLYLLITSPKS